MGSGSEELIENVCSCDDSSEEVGGKVIGRKMCRGMWKVICLVVVRYSPHFNNI